ncbi:TlyA family RNA methyltransferase [Larsenimonas rhizosphaerae]|uniref:TlyA family RNA methyltransferase n=1 Tax=Larsenimonas rhizosphaerae TaxID=2944682 RepID=A0AA41ZG05_9GAMM|nr:TlyA family RNA methyltransferase [Larsenimonas rhizosphaerae]MCX2524612.1 TlyA family RNA methyltransferase [Larsenimonas rhizosphaerae]
MGNVRADQMLVSQGLARSRTRAQRLIRHGRVHIERQGRQILLTRPGEKCPEGSRFIVTPDPEDTYVSRAGLKLEALLTHTSVPLEGLAVLDVGQSTGGFTDCALAHGARQVIGIDVGHEQLDDELRKDARVICIEGCNARTLTLETIAEWAPEGPDAVVMDVSFISQTLILPALAALMPSGTPLLSLVKPQFELSPDAINTRGLVRSTDDYDTVRTRLASCCDTVGLDLLAWIDSPITGGDGNREFLMHARRR